MAEPWKGPAGHRGTGDRASAAASPPLVPAGGRFSGLLDVRGQPGRIDGSVDGEIIASGSLWIGAEARVRARVEARDVVVEGEVEGEIRAESRVDLRATARVRATLHTRCFVLAEGAIFEGRCHTLAGAAPAAEAADSESRTS